MPTPRFRAYVDWAGDGTFTGPADEVTADLLVRTQVEVGYGRSDERALSPMGPGLLAGELDNRSGIYSPESTDLPLAGDILPSRPVYLTADWQSQTYGVYRGLTDGYDVLPGWPDMSVKFDCADALASFVAEISTELYSGISTGRAIGIVLDAMGWPPGKRDLDAGATTIPWFWLNRSSATAALQQIVDSEGPPALLTMDAAGNVVFRDRNHRLTRTASTGSQATFGTGGIPVLLRLVYGHGVKEIINSLTFEVPVRAPSAQLEDVWTMSGTKVVPDGATVPVIVSATDPFRGAVAPVAGVDIVSTGGAVTATLTQTSGQSTTILLKSTGGTSTITSLKLRAYPVSVRTTELVKAEDPTSQSRYGIRTWPSLREPAWASLPDAQAIADLILAQRAQRIPTVRIEVANRSDAAVTQQLTRNLSDRIRLTIPTADLDSEFFIERIEHTIDEGGRVFTTALFLERVPTTAANWLVLDSSTQGRLNSATLGGVGLSSSTTAFRLGDPLRGLLNVNLLGF